jgi:hypothetical protein
MLVQQSPMQRLCECTQIVGFRFAAVDNDAVFDLDRWLYINQTVHVDKVIKSLKMISFSAVHVRSDGHNLLLWEICVNIDSIKSVSQIMTERNLDSSKYMYSFEKIPFLQFQKNSNCWVCHRSLFTTPLFSSKMNIYAKENKYINELV